jgi:hypothetical protein
MAGRLILISGAGYGSGKSSYARRLLTFVHKGVSVSLAGGIRAELSAQYPHYNWWAQDQEGKQVLVKETSMTIREMLIKHGQTQCLVKRVALTALFNDNKTVVIDDVRKLVELDFFKSKCEELQVPILHHHVVGPKAVAEPQYNNEELKALAEYVVTWGEDIRELKVPTSEQERREHHAFIPSTSYKRNS